MERCKKIGIVFILVFMIFVITSADNARADAAKDAFLKGYAYIDNNKPETAITHFNDAIEINPNYAAAFRERGFAYYLLNEHLDAIVNYKKAIAFNSQDFLAWNNLGLAYHALRLVNMSKKAVKRAAEIEPDYAQAHLNLVHIYWLEGETDVFTEKIKQEARYHLKEYLRIMPDAEESKDVQEKIKWLDASIGTGNIIIVPEEQEDGEFSTENLDKIKDWLHDKPQEDLEGKEHITLGVLLLRNNFLEESAGEFKEAIRLAPYNADIYMLLGGIYLKTGKFGESIDYYSKALELDPASEQSSLGLGRAYLQSNNIKAARQQIEALQTQDSALANTLEKEIKTMKK